jgi:TetR/AcrR family transcriptional regulator, transcriptional repressor for nem operon
MTALRFPISCKRLVWKKAGFTDTSRAKKSLRATPSIMLWKVAMGARFEGTEEIPNTVDRLKQIVRNFRDRRTGLVPGGCPLLNTAIDFDDGNPKLRAKARQALNSLLDRLQSITQEGNDEARYVLMSIRRNWLP